MKTLINKPDLTSSHKWGTITLRYVGACVRHGLTLWATKDDDVLSIAWYNCQTIKKISHTDPLQVRKSHGLPENFSFKNMDTGEWRISGCIVNKYFKKLRR